MPHSTVAPIIQDRLDIAVAQCRRQFARFMFVDLVLTMLLSFLVSFRAELVQQFRPLGVMNCVSAVLFFLDFILMGWLLYDSKDCTKVTDASNNASLITLKAKTWANFVLMLLTTGAFVAFVALKVVDFNSEYWSQYIGWLCVTAYLVLQLVELWSFTKVLSYLARRDSGAAREPFATEAGIQDLPDILVGRSVSVAGRTGVVSWDGRPMNGYLKVKWSDTGEQSKVIKISEVTLAD